MATSLNRTNRPKKTTAELIALINQRHEDWWPREFQLTITRTAEHDWTAITDLGVSGDFASSIGRVVAELRLRHAWAGR
jgi:hypothetical protein